MSVMGEKSCNNFFLVGNAIMRDALYRDLQTPTKLLRDPLDRALQTPTELLRDPRYRASIDRGSFSTPPRGTKKPLQNAPIKGKQSSPLLDLFNQDLVARNPTEKILYSVNYVIRSITFQENDVQTAMHNKIQNALGKGNSKVTIEEFKPPENYVFKQKFDTCQMYATFQIVFLTMWDLLDEWTRNVLLGLMYDTKNKNTIPKLPQELSSRPDIMRKYREFLNTENSAEQTRVTRVTKRKDTKVETPENGDFSYFLQALLDSMKKPVKVRVVEEGADESEGADEHNDVKMFVFYGIDNNVSPKESWEVAVNKARTFDKKCAFCVRVEPQPHFLVNVGNSWYDTGDGNKCDNYTKLRHYEGFDNKKGIKGLVTTLYVLFRPTTTDAREVEV